jgi:hypothetical protein
MQERVMGEIGAGWRSGRRAMRSTLSRGNRASPMTRSPIHPGLRAGPESTISASIWNCSATVLASDQPHLDFRMIVLKCREAQNEPAHRKGWQRRDPQRLLKAPLAHAFAAAASRSSAGPVSFSSAARASVATALRLTRTNSFKPSHSSNAQIRRLTAPCVTQSRQQHA